LRKGQAVHQCAAAHEFRGELVRRQADFDRCSLQVFFKAHDILLENAKGSEAAIAAEGGISNARGILIAEGILKS
jgi:hypothetical protein